VEVQPGVLVAARVTEKKAEVMQTFDEVKGVIANKLKQEKALARAREIGKKSLADLKAGKTVELRWSASQEIDRATASDYAGVVREIFQVSAKAVPGYVGVETPYGYAIYRVNKVTEQKDESMATNVVAQLQQIYGEQKFLAYLKALEQKYPVKAGSVRAAPAEQ
jgi:peptidyl-prolyl cis-trans isomerase D